MDLFSSGVEWKVNKKAEVSTSIGKITSLLITIVILIFIFYTIIIFSLKNDPVTSITVKFNKGPDDKQLGTLFDEIFEVVILPDSNLSASSYPYYIIEIDVGGKDYIPYRFEIKPPFVGISESLNEGLVFRHECVQKRQWPDSSNPIGISQLAPYLGVPASTCSEKVNQVLLEAGKDPSQAICAKLNLRSFDESLNLTYSQPPVLSVNNFFTCFGSFDKSTNFSKSGTEDLYSAAYYLTKRVDWYEFNSSKIELNISSYSICNIIPSANLEDYERPFKWSLSCSKENEVKFRASVVALRTDSNVLEEKYDIIHVRYLKIDSSKKDSNKFYSFSYKGPLKSEYFEYTRRYNKLIDVFASIKAIWIALGLIVHIFAKKLMNFEKKLIIFNEMTKLKPELLKHIESKIKMSDFFKAKIIRSKTSIYKLKEMETILEEKFYSKIEITNFISEEEEALKGQGSPNERKNSKFIR